jgi:hypothetical protein
MISRIFPRLFGVAGDSLRVWSSEMRSLAQYSRLVQTVVRRRAGHKPGSQVALRNLRAFGEPRHFHFAVVEVRRAEFVLALLEPVLVWMETELSRPRTAASTKSR